MPFTADSIAAQQVQECLKLLYSSVHDIEKRRQSSENGINAINKLHSQEGSNQHFQAEAKALYKTAVVQVEQEEELLRKALQKITEIRVIKNERRIQARNAGNKETIRRGAWMKMLLSSAQTLPLFVSKIGEKPPPLCGAIPAEPNYYAKVGDMVAALVKVAEGDGDNWILAEVVSFTHTTNKYEVDDILEEQNQKKRHTLSKKYVVPLPLMRANPETDSSALFPQGTVVMVARIHPTRVTPVMQSDIHNNNFRRATSAETEQNTTESSEYLPGVNNSRRTEPSSVSASIMNEREVQEDQVSLESRVIPNESITRTADGIKSPPPPYTAEDLPTYEEAIGWNKSKYG